MKILYLKLKNYATIYTAMGLKEIEIDFTKSKNNVILFVGENGSGKTSLLSTLHPFAYYGSMDTRNNTDIIREGKDGYKEIHIQYNKDIYKIQHYYKNSKKSIILKSFIQKNGEELNPNGNVTSFNEVIKNELSLELDFLRLLRLGSNVTNLIDMKASERKSFTSLLLSDINMYNDLFKKVSEDNRILKSMIKTVSDKLIKLNVVDRAVLESDIKNQETKLNEYTTRKNKLQHQLGLVEGQITALLPDGIDNMNNMISELQLSLKDNRSKQNSIVRNIDKLCIILASDIDTEINNISVKLSNKENEYTINKNMELFYREQMNPLYKRVEELTNQLKVTVSDITYRQMSALYVEISEKVNEYNKKYKDYTPIYTKDNLINLLEILKQIDNVVSEIYTFDMRAVKKTISMIRDSENIDAYIIKKTKEIDKDILKITSDLKSSINPKSPVILFKPSNCVENDCPYLYLYDMIFGAKTNESKSLSSLETEKEILETISNINKNIEYIFMILKTNMNLISKGNISYFSIDNILSSIENGSSVFDENYMTNLISESEEYEEYIDLKTKMKELKTELNLLNSNSSNVDNMKKEIEDLNTKITDLSNKIFSIEKSNEELNDEIRYIKSYYDSLLLYKDYINTYNLLTESINDTQMKLDDIMKLLDSVSVFKDQIKDIQKELSLVNWNIDKLNSEIFDNRVKLKDFVSLTEERDTLNNKFDDVSLIRESLSANKGIPILYMQLYLKNTKLFVNELLKMVYSDNFEIDDFDINESEFNIPYIKNNIRISDVVYASQGEKSFLSLALSFALINQSIKNYNILLLDEIDSTLDIRNRAMFLNILEKQMESIDAEQVFLITHNNMFENYPVDLILTSGNKTNHYNNANIIFSL